MHSALWLVVSPSDRQWRDKTENIVDGNVLIGNLQMHPVKIKQFTVLICLMLQKKKSSIILVDL